MNVQRFTGSNNREAMRKVKDALGDDALILANRSTDQGVEILAASEKQALASSGRSVATAPAASPLAPAEDEAWGNRLFQEMQGVRALLEKSAQPPENAVSNGQKLRAQMIQAGFSETLTTEMIQDFPSEWLHEAWCKESIRGWLLRQLQFRLSASGTGAALIDGGGVFALVGPTGSGKTTTTAKIAAHYVMRQGPSSLALVSADSYRIGAHEQLREYANLLKVDFRAVAAGQSLDKVLSGLERKKVVLIDTVGLSQRDQKVLEQFTQLQAARQKITFLLLLNAASHGGTLEEVVNCYRQSAATAGGAIDHCIFTKLDEACSPVMVIDKAVCHGLQPIYMSSGQRVPEDLEQPDIAGLMHGPLTELVEQVPGENAAETMRSTDWTRDLLSRGRQVGVTLRMLEASVAGFERLEALWDISLLHHSWQQARIDELLRQSPGLGVSGNGILWADDNPIRGCSYQCPDLVLDDQLRPSAVGFLQYRQPIDHGERLAAAHTHYGADQHIFASLPNRTALQWLEDSQRQWLAMVPPGKYINLDGDNMQVARIKGEGLPVRTFPLRFRAQNAALDLANIPVEFRANRDRHGSQTFAGLAWRGVVRSRDTGVVLAEQHWLSSPTAFGCQPMLCRQMAMESLPSLTRRLWLTLESIPGFQGSRDLRLLVASGLAATALAIETWEADEAIELRAQLHAVLGGKRSYSARSMLDALSYLFIARELVVPGRAN